MEIINLSVSRDFKKNTAFLTLGTFINRGLQFVTIPFFSRWLSTEEYGQFDLLVTYVSLLLPIITLSCHEGIFRMTVNEVDNSKINGFITSGLVIDIANYSVVSIVLYLVYGRKNSLILGSFLLYLLGEVALIYLRGVLRGLKKLSVYSFAQLFSTIIMIVAVTILVLLCGWGLNGIIIGYAMGSALGAVLMALYAKCWKYIRISNVQPGMVKSMLYYSVPLIPNDLSWWIMNASDRQIINFFYGNSANGIYAIAHKIPAICSIIISTVSLSWQQEVTLNLEQKKQVDLNSYLNYIIRIAFSFSAVLVAGSFILYKFIFDIKYYDACRYSPILIFSSSFMAISLFLGGILVGYKRTKSNGFSTIIGAVTNVVIHLLLISYIGLYAAAISTLVSSLIVCCIRIYSLRDIYKFRFDKRTVLYSCFVVYFIVSTFVDGYMGFNVLNILIAILFFVFANRNLISSIASKFARMIKNDK